MTRRKRRPMYLNLSFGDTGPNAIHGFVMCDRPKFVHHANRDYAVWFTKTGGIRLGQGYIKKTRTGLKVAELDEHEVEMLQKLLAAAKRWKKQHGVLACGCVGECYCPIEA